MSKNRGGITSLWPQSCGERKPIGAHKTGGNMGEQGTRGLMTVGELASRVGVTVRTIQYYDQRGLLHPTCKGEQNLRLYSPADEERLNRTSP